MQTDGAACCVVSNVSCLTSLTLGPSKVCQAPVTGLASKAVVTLTEGGRGTGGDKALPIPTALSRTDQVGAVVSSKSGETHTGGSVVLQHTVAPVRTVRLTWTIQIFTEVAFVASYTKTSLVVTAAMSRALGLTAWV